MPTFRQTPEYPSKLHQRELRKTYEYTDMFKDVVDLLNRIEAFDMDVGIPYPIVGVWGTKLEAVIRKDSEASRYPDDEFSFSK